MNVPIEEMEKERLELRRSAIQYAMMILADAVSGTLKSDENGGVLSQSGALLDLENSAIRYANRLNELEQAPESSEPQN